MAYHLAVLNMPVQALKRSHAVTSFEREHLGLPRPANRFFK